MLFLIDVASRFVIKRKKLKEDVSVTIRKYSSLNQKSFWGAVITNDGSEVVLCGRNVRVFDCNREQFSHTLSRLTRLSQYLTIKNEFVF